MVSNKNPPHLFKLFEVRLLKDPQETEQWAIELMSQLDRRHILGLVGAMGSGKTHFVKALAKAMGYREGQANSPTFALHQEYHINSANAETAGIQTLHHWDLYRLESEDEIESSGFWDLFYEDSIIMAIEWIDRIPEKMLPLHFSYWRLEWEVLSNNYRKVSVYQRLSGDK